jgi:hypothetical protein
MPDILLAVFALALVAVCGSVGVVALGLRDVRNEVRALERRLDAGRTSGPINLGELPWKRNKGG